MQLSIHQEEKLWRLGDMAELHVLLLRQAAQDASMEDDRGGQARLYPSPVSFKEVLQEGEFLEDWKEYVTEELHTQFASDVGVLLNDLEALEAEETGGEASYHLSVPIDHGSFWFSTLNQARLLLDQKYVLHPNGGEFEADASPESLLEVDPAQRLSASMRYEFYAVIQVRWTPFFGQK